MYYDSPTVAGNRRNAALAARDHRPDTMSDGDCAGRRLRGGAALLLAGDIGGTKSLLALYSKEGGPRAPIRSTEFASQRFPSLEAVIREFLGGSPVADSACFGVAGHVIEGSVKITNLPWAIDEAGLRAEFDFSSVTLLNDVQATAHAIPFLRDDERETVIEGRRAPQGPVALAAAGTGLGEAFAIWDGGRYRALPSEGGHADFAPTTDEQTALLAYLRQRYEHVSYELVCSAIGIQRIYEFLRDRPDAVETPAVAERLSRSDDRARVIIESARDANACPLCVRTVEIFASILGAEAGNLALKFLATGGVYVAGGIPRSILPFLRRPAFGEAYHGKGRFSELLSRIPLHVITADAALLGSALWGLAAETGRPPS